MLQSIMLCFLLMLSTASGALAQSAIPDAPAPDQAKGEMAGQAAEAAHAENPQDSAEEEAIVKAKMLLNAKKFARAIDCLQDASAKTPKSPRLHLWLGNAFWAICDYRQAIKQFDAAIQDANDKDAVEFARADAQAHKAVCQARLGFYDLAVESFREAAKTRTGDVTVTLLISRALLEHKDYQATIAYLEGVNSQAPERLEMASNLLLALAQAQAGLGNLDEATATLDKTLSADGHFPLGFIARARIKQRQSKYDEAIADARSALGLNKSMAPQAHLIIGQCLLSQGKSGDAEAEIDLAVEAQGPKPSGEMAHYKALLSEHKGNSAGGAAGRAAAVQLGYSDPPSLIVVSREALSQDKIFSGFATVVAGEHFLCYGDVSLDKLSGYSRLAESFAGYVRTNVCPLQGSYPAFLFMLHDKASEQHFLKDRLSFGGHVHGVFMTGNNAVTTYDGAGTGTFLHEIMHKFLYKNISHDFWADEGVPCFFEKVYGYYDKDQPTLTLKTGYPQASAKLSGWLGHDGLKLSQVVASAKYADPGSEEAQRMVALFLNDQGKLHDFLDLTYKNQRGKYNYFIEAAFDKPLTELDPIFDDYLKRLNDKKALISRLPGAEIFEDKNQLEAFMQKQRIPAEKW